VHPKAAKDIVWKKGDKEMNIISKLGELIKEKGKKHDPFYSERIEELPDGFVLKEPLEEGICYDCRENGMLYTLLVSAIGPTGTTICVCGDCLNKRRR